MMNMTPLQPQTNLEEVLKSHWEDKPQNYLPKGWENLVLNLHKKIVEIDPNYTLCQIKSKFGALRFYYDSDKSNLIDKLVSEAEEKSTITCEKCGKPGSSEIVNNWMITLCGECYDKLNRSTE